MLSARCYLVVVLWHFWGDGHDLPGYTAPIILKNLGNSYLYASRITYSDIHAYLTLFIVRCSKVDTHYNNVVGVYNGIIMV